ncbi:DJ-1 family glyoxalase III [Suttonella ornithocola]|uniref:Chaperone protein YajL n=1 Tax=Suttonella ornithocola TaxID=279832 RepID=A0A380MS16_9GAMM|nr:DJ-1 family glyoxalase III [Suttonella ornithocola]SUO94964.1 Chaperone protein YajL [Suttonella ornithocola]
MANVLLFLTDGFEEIEALATVDVLRRGEVDVKTISLTGKPIVTGSHHIPVQADQLFEQTNFSDVDMLIIPGGTKAFNDYPALKETIQTHYNKGKKIAAICAAPMVFGTMGLLKGKKATCYPGFEEYLEGAEVQKGTAVVVDGLITTGRGPSLAISFALELLAQLTTKENSQKVAEGLLIAQNK